MRSALLCATVLAFVAVSEQGAAHEISGTVVDEDGAPLTDAKVWLNQFWQPRVASVDDAGRFSFGDVETGPVQLVAHAPGHAIGGRDGQCIDDIEVTLICGEPAPTSLRIIDTRYKPIAGARVRELTVDGGFTVAVEDLVPLGFPSPRSDDSGLLTLPYVPRDTFMSITIRHASYADSALPALPAGIDLDFPMTSGVEVGGRVVAASGDGIAAARVSIFRVRQDNTPVEIAETVTGPEGFYRAVVPAGQYYVAARHPRHGTPSPVGLAARADKRDNVANIAMLPVHTLTGRAVNEDDAPVALARFAYQVEGFVVAETVSDATGRFALQVPQGRGLLRIRAPERMISMDDDTLLFDKALDGPIDMGTVRFRKLPNLRGQVRVPEGVDSGRVLIASLNLEYPVYATTDAEGRFEIELGAVPDGPVAFSAEHALRFLRGQFRVDVERDNDVVVKIERYRPDTPAAEARARNDLESLLGKPAPPLVCDAWFNLPEGRPSLDLNELRGKVVVLTLWGGFDASGFTGNRMRQLNALRILYEGVDDVALVGVHDAGMEPVQVEQYIRALGIDYPVGCDADPFQTFEAYKTTYIPQTVIIDKEGRLRFYRVEGRLLELIKRVRRR